MSELPNIGEFTDYLSHYWLFLQSMGRLFIEKLIVLK
jgi:hypothetical protein